MALSDSTAATAGWVVFVAAFGMLFSMISVDLVALHGWDQAMTPAFVGVTIGHIAAVVTAFIGGKLIPAQRDSQQTRATDPPKGS